MKHLYGLFIFLPMLISFFWAVTFLSGLRKKNIARFVLGIFMIVQTLVYLCHGLFFSGDREIYLAFDAFYNFVGLCSYPMYYLYIRLLSSDTQPKYYYIWHFIPPFILAFILQICLFSMNFSDKTNYFNNAVMLRRYPQNASQIVYVASTVFFIIRLVFSIQVIFYLTKSYLLVKKYDERIQNFYSNTEGKKLIWAKALLISLMIASVMSLIVNVLGRGFFTGDGGKENLVFIPSLLFSTLIFFMGLQGYKQDHNIVNFKEDGGKEEDNYSIPTYKKDLIEKLHKTILKDQVFLDKEFNIIKLSESLRTNRTYISHLINEEYQMSFNDFINQFRVEYAKKLIDSDPEQTYSLDSIAEESGFGSFSSFNRAFKKFEKKTATGYRK